MEAIGVGTATIKIISTDQKTGEKATAECMVTVLEAPTPDPAAKEDPVTVKPLEEDKLIPVESITIEPELFFIKMNEERQINVKIKPFNANAEDVIIKSYDSKIIDINEGAELVGLVLDNIWTKTKELLSGESFQVKTPSATCGVRG